MANITVQVLDATGNKRQEVELPDNAPVNRIIAVLQKSCPILWLGLAR